MAHHSCTSPGSTAHLTQRPQAGVAPASHYCQSLHPGCFLCVCTSLSCVSLIPVAFKELVSPHSPASQLSLLSCFMREITRRPVCQQLLCKSYLQKEEGMRREVGGEGGNEGGGCGCHRNREMQLTTEKLCGAKEKEGRVTGVRGAVDRWAVA